MLSWNDDADVFTKRGPLGKAGSLARPGNSFEAQRTASSRTSVEVPVPPGTRKSGESTLSPTSSLTKANSLLRGPGNAAEGTIGSEGWWHHMDNSQMNEPPVVDDKAKGGAKAAAFVPQYNITGQKQSLWADEAPAAPTPVAPATPPALTAPGPTLVAEAVLAAPTAASAPATTVGSDGVATIQSAAATGWWAHMDNSILNQPAETTPLAPGSVRKGERVMGGGFTPQFNVAGGNRYGSIFGEEAVQQQQPSGGAVEGGAAGDDGWSSFESAPTKAG